MSIGVSGVYGGSRTLVALAQQGYAPGMFTHIDRAGRPTLAVGVILICGLLAYINLNTTGAIVFDWLLALSGLAALFTWGSICLSHIRFRKAWAYHGHTLEEIPFKAIGGVYGSWLGLILCILVLIASVSFIFPYPGHSSLLVLLIENHSLVLQRHLPTRTRRAWHCRGLLHVHARTTGGDPVLGYWIFLEGKRLA